jgi:hypothetical protein
MKPEPPTGLPGLPGMRASLGPWRGRARLVLTLMLALGGAAAHAQDPAASSAPVAGVLGPRARTASADPELDALHARLSSLAQAARTRKASDPQLEPALRRGRAAIEHARATLAASDRESLARHKQIGWAAVAVLSRILELQREHAALRSTEVRAQQAHQERAHAQQVVAELRAQLEELRGALDEQARQPAQQAERAAQTAPATTKPAHGPTAKAATKPETKPVPSATESKP